MSIIKEALSETPSHAPGIFPPSEVSLTFFSSLHIPVMT